MPPRRTELLKGTLDLLILRTLSLEPRHGMAIADRIAQITGGTFDVRPGSLFPALHRLAQEGFITGNLAAIAGGPAHEVLRADGGRAAASSRPRSGSGRESWGRWARCSSPSSEARMRSAGSPHCGNRSSHEVAARPGVDEELQAYLEESIDRKCRAGMDAAEARRAALAELGGSRA